MAGCMNAFLIDLPLLFCISEQLIEKSKIPVALGSRTFLPTRTLTLRIIEPRSKQTLGVKHDRIRPMGMQGKALRHTLRISPVPMPDKDQRALLNACMLRGASPSRTHYPLDLQFDPLELCKGGGGKKKNTPKRMGKASHPDKQREGNGKLQALTCELRE